MAAHMDGPKLTKSERKAWRRQLKSHHTLFKHESIETVSSPTPHLVVANGGLGNSVRHEELQLVFQRYGNILDIVMKSQKPYAFVSFTSDEEAEAALTNISGRLLQCPEELSVPGVRLFPSYVASVPGCEVPKKQLPEGIALLEQFVSEDYEQKLLQAINWEEEEEDENLSGDSKHDLKHRRVKHYGYEFLYGANNVNPDRPLKRGIPRECDKVVDRLLALGHLTSRPDQLTVNQYQPGQGIPPHVDTHSAFDDVILSLSLGSQVVMDFRHPEGDHIPVLLPRRSALLMKGEGRYLWSHGITPRKSDVVPIVAPGLEPGGATSAGIQTPESRVEQERLTLAKRETRTSFTFRRLRRGPCKCSYAEQCDSQKDSLLSKGSLEEVSSTRPPLAPATDREAAILEKQHVHEVYEEIADHFSDTRYKAWPRVADFLKSTPGGSLVVDIGCGNGKYLGANKEIYMMGCDRSYNLCGICEGRGHPVFVCDALSVPVRDDSVDVAVSIAVIHHLSTLGRRTDAVREMARILRPGGRGLIYVWAFEQDRGAEKSAYLRQSRIAQKQGLDGDSAVFPDLSGSRLTPEDCPSKPEQVDNKSNEPNTERVGSSAAGGKFFDPDLCNCEGGTSSEKHNLGPESGKPTGVFSADNSQTNEPIEDDENPQVCNNEPPPGGSSFPACSNNLDDTSSNLGTMVTPGGDLEPADLEPVISPISVCVRETTGSRKEPSQSGTSGSLIKSSLPVHLNRTHFASQDLLVPWHLKDKQRTVRNTHKTTAMKPLPPSGDTATAEISPESSSTPVYHRFYHVFREGELEELCCVVPNVSIVESYYDKGNWCVIFKKT